MAPRGRGRDHGRGHTNVRAPEINPNDPLKFMTALENMAATMQATAEALRQQMNNHGNDRGGVHDPMTLANFLKVNPPKFKGTTSPTEANTWFQAMKTAKELELLQLKQGTISVSEYADKFEELFRFFRMCHGTPGDYEEWKCNKYEGGLQSDIFSSVGPMEIRIFSELVNKSRVAEECVKKAVVERGSHKGSFPQN
ncbi:uncharacterized protein LOC107479615 [Arachis duranensis]|uniref:Uncharacterized protein LOC107479615 n=1 Tax=Arachis duranensis TaxID=130453 RepID=A0A6P4CQU3_ARADU|nr:uncharacterized protein LOC107479615 [Arachis duranensis]